jgi:hypothetical protein
MPADSGTSITELDVLAFDNAEGSEHPIGEGEHGPEVRVRLGNLYHGQEAPTMLGCVGGGTRDEEARDERAEREFGTERPG